MSSTADPFLLLESEHHNTFSGKEGERQVNTLPLHLAQKEQPWHRLHEDPTLASSRRHYLHFESQAPKDSLDLHLKATYDHHQDFLWSKNQTLYQKETFTDDHGLLLKEQPRGHGTERAKLRVWIDPQKSSIYSVKGPIGENAARGLHSKL
uniref:Uncharacterized protein n=1 Tax=Scleropages formosus TaxID=113540 RepID=A0A8C9SLC6_SCLFO